MMWWQPDGVRKEDKMMIRKLLGGGEGKEARGEAYEVLRKMLVASRFPPLVHAVLRVVSTLECDWVRVGELIRKVDRWLKEIGSGQEEGKALYAGTRMTGAYLWRLGLVRKKEYRRLRELVGYRINQGWARFLLQVLETSPELNAMCWTTRGIRWKIEEVVKQLAKRTKDSDFNATLTPEEWGLLQNRAVHLCVEFHEKKDAEELISKAWSPFDKKDVQEGLETAKKVQGKLIVKKVFPKKPPTQTPA